ncbi:hypothetical protein M0R45_001383 [Rubus argutus]|uniref:Laccase n=1 Tax=Rubus argutus TaxID=59490 RepID=A0AAW1VKT0_RUBAR
MGLRKMGSMLGLLGIFLLDGLLLSMAYNVHHYSFILKETNFTRLCFTKPMLTVNEQFPGPTIHVRKGDRAFVNVHNDGKYGVTLHWHGVKQPLNPWSDGPENITQCPIQPGKNFTYEVIFSDEEGTLWWHAHSDWSRATVHGPIVILPPRGKAYPYPKPYAEETLVLASWFNTDVKELIDDAMAIGGDPAVSDAFTINGWPGALYNCTNETIYRLPVVYGKTYHLRLVNAIMNEEMFFAIAGHNFTVVAQDGAYIKPIPTSYLMITPGQTMDILLTANQTPSYYYIAARPFFDSGAPFDNTTTTAILQYTNVIAAPTNITLPTLPIQTDHDSADNFTSKIKALASKDHPISVPKNVTKHVLITVSVNQLPCELTNGTCGGPNGSRLSASLNNISFATPTTDILQAYYRSLPNVFENDFPDQPPLFFNFSGVNSSIYLLPEVGTKVLFIEYGASVELVYQGTNIGNPENHPMHLHGYSFYVVGSAYGNWNATTSPATYNLIDPPEVNTIGVPKNGWTAIRFVAKNPGVWFMHCHLERHASWGMDTVIVVKNGPSKGTSIQRPPRNLPICA